MAEIEAAALIQPSAPPPDALRISDEEKTMLDPNATEPPKKRRRVAKPNADKKFECKHEGCGKSYSRAEHLYRHQLNRKYFRLFCSLRANHVTRHPEKYILL